MYDKETSLRHFILIAVLGIAMAVAAPAFAGGSSVLSGHTAQPPAAQTLKPKTKSTTGEVAGAASPKTTKSPGTLPFTGLDLGFAGLAGAALVGAGFALRRAGRSTR